MNTTVRMKASDIYKDWHVIDAADRALGRVASEAATLLRGKHKPTFEPHLDGGDFVIVVNAAKVRVTGRKEAQIKYHRHSGYPGGLKTRTYAQQMARFPDRIIEQAIWGMLPDGPLGKKMLKHLKVYAGPNHPHASQIAFTEKARASRAETEAALSTAGMKAPRLRPLSIPQVLETTATEAVPSPGRPSPDRKGGPRTSAAQAAPTATRGKAPKSAAASTTATELEATTDAVLSSETPPPASAALNEDIVVAENATPPEAAVAQGEAIVTEKPKRARKAVSEETTGGAGAAPRPRARKPKAETEASPDAATEPKKPARRRTAPKGEE